MLVLPQLPNAIHTFMLPLALTELQIGLDMHVPRAECGTLPYFLQIAQKTYLHLAHN